MRKKLEVKTGDIYGHLTIIREVEQHIQPSGQKKRRFLCQCDCGSAPVEVWLSNLRRGNTTSCGCVQKERVKESVKGANKKYNTYDLTGEYGIGYTQKGENFLFDLEDYDLIKGYCWRISNGYVVTTDLITNRLILMHRLVMNCPEEKYIDHIFHQTNDNRKSQLREVTPSQNNMNHKIKSGNTSGVTGVGFDKQCCKWRARICVNRKIISLGTYANIEEAIQARLEAEEKYFGEFSPNSDKFKNE